MRLHQANGTWQLNREEKTAMFKSNGKIGRRDLFKTSAGIMGGALVSREAAAEQAAQRNVNTLSSPSALRITDLRVATVVKPGPSPCPIIRLDTNQGVYGLGEVRDGASATYALFLKSRLLNENPLNITYLFDKVKQFGFPGRQAARASELPAGERRAVPHPFIAGEITQKGIEVLSEYGQAGREAVGMEIPLS